LDPSPPIPYFPIISLHRVFKELSETAVTEMKPGVLKEKQFQMLELRKKFTANVLKYPSVISRSYSGSSVINKKYVAYLEQTKFIFCAERVQGYCTYIYLSVIDISQSSEFLNVNLY
jgi:hypothetical protein